MANPAAHHLVITIHGIRTFGGWQERLEVLLRSAEAPQGTHLEVHNYKFGYFSVIAFLLPPMRWLVTRRFRKALRELSKARSWDRIDVVAHSFGTHLFAWGLLGIPKDRRPRIHTVILAGSVLKPSFQWQNLVGSSVLRVINDCGTCDNVLVINQLVVLFTGLAGRIGFSGMTGRSLRNRYFGFGHSGYFRKVGSEGDDDAFMRTYWVPLLTTETDVAVVRDPRRGSALEGLSTFLLNNSEPLKLSAYFALFLSAFLWIYGLYVEAERQRKFAEERALVATAGMLLPSQSAKANLVALDVGRPEVVPGGLSLLLNALATPLDEPTVYDTTGAEVRQVAVSPDGARVVIASRDGEEAEEIFLEIFDAVTGRRTRQLKSLGAPQALSFVGTEKVVLIDWNDRVLLWENDRLTPLSADSGLAAALSPNGKLVAQASANRITVWSTESRKMVFSAEAPAGIRSVVLSNKPAGLGVKSDRSSWLWEPEESSWVEQPAEIIALSSSGGYALRGTAVVALSGSGAVTELEFEPWRSNGFIIEDAAFSQDDKLVVGWEAELLVLWDRESGKILKAVRPADDTVVIDAKFSVGHPVVVIAAEGNGRVRLLATRSPFESRFIRPHADRADFAPGPGGLLVTGALGGTAAGWSLLPVSFPAFGSLKRDSWSETGHIPFDVAASEDGSRVSAMYGDGEAKVWSTVNGRELAVHRTGGTGGKDQGVEFLGDRLILFGEQGAWIGEGPGRRELEEGRELFSLRLSRDERFLVGNTEWGEGRVWDIGTRKIVGRVRRTDLSTAASIRHEGLDADYCPRRDLIAVAFWDGGVELWKLDQRELERDFPHGAPVWSVGFSADCELLLTASGDGLVRLWDIDRRKDIRQLDLSEPIRSRGSWSPILAAAWSPLDSYITVLNPGGPIWVYNSLLERELAYFPNESYTALAFATDESTLFAGSTKGVVHSWPMDSQMLRGAIRARSSRCLGADFRMHQLGQAPADAIRKERTCRRCIDTYFVALRKLQGRVPAGSALAQAWSAYARCLEE